MGAKDEARSHVAKAEEFLAAAHSCLDQELFNAATSNAVICGINAKDAVCLVLTGRTTKSDNHDKAVVELKQAGGVGRELATTLGRLLKVKPKSQYQAASMSASDAERAVQWAQKLLDAAKRVVTA